ncbi:nitroreductase/quinone reductase family protein [Streptomyces sp. NPDC052236]|uniref:nitroreductase/quinone reductase family protein n=1 Tax=Streptomyces sp. NPDC052236 TaxID=3365686 RepID=UPI0037D4B758
MSDLRDMNELIMKEFRENGGRVGGMFEGAPLALLTTTGARSGRPHTNPAVYVHDGGRLLVFASNAGGPRHPHWFHNLLADPRVMVEIADGDGGVSRYPARAEPLTGEERDRQYAAQCARDPAFGAYQAATERTIPVVALTAVDFGDAEANRAIGEYVVRVHDELRRELAAVRTAIQPSRSLGQQLAQHCLTFCGALHTHHTNEDGAFDALQKQFPSLGPAIDRIRQEHTFVAVALSRLEALLSAEGADPVPEALRRELDQLATQIEEHFVYEEEQLLPALLGPGAHTVRSRPSQ